MPTLRLDSLRVLVYTHRWLGIAGGLLMLIWFASGIVMVYHRLPEVGAAERLDRLAPLDARAIRVAPLAAASAADVRERGFTLSMVGERPVYRFGVGTVYADDGEPLGSLSEADALSLAADFGPASSGSAAYDARLTEPDQWTLQSRAFLPLHRVVLGDAEDTHLYVSDRTGEVVMRTTRSGRAWGYAGAVLHWLYFTPFRIHSTLWAQTIIWLSVAGCVLTLSGLLWGLLRFSPGRQHRPSGRKLQRSPYTGLLRWHHYAGLVFGLFSFTWMLSGGLSMDPWSWHPGTAPTAEQREGVSLGALDLAGLSAADVRTAAAALAAGGPVAEVRLVRFRGEEYLVGYRVTQNAADGDRIETRLVPAGGSEREVFERFPDADMMDAAVDAMPDVGMRGLAWLDEHDSYYYARYDAAVAAPLPVLRVDYADSQRTTLYLDPRSGAIARKEERLTRINRWLYHGLHSLDVPFLYERRPLWDVVVIVLSMGGIALAGTTIWPGFKRVGRRLRQAAGQGIDS